MKTNQKIQPLPTRSITIEDKFWKDYMELIRQNVIPYQWEALNDRIEDAEPSYCMQNFKVASGAIEGKFQGMVFQDSDVYKWLEAVAFSLTWHPDEQLEALADGAIDTICAAQQPDGYLNTYYIINGLDKRFTNLKDNHELYCLGHMIEGAVAYFQSTGKRKFMDAAIRYVDCVAGIFGPQEGKLHGYPGHEVIEMALVRLYRATGEKRFLDLASYFIDERGKAPLYFQEENERNKNAFYWADSYFQYQYYQAGKPVREQEVAQGHAVRAVYLYSGMADVARESADEALLAVCEKLWDNITRRQMYITGGIGSSQHGESFTFDYDLPNDTVYAETCASIGLIFFAIRMFEITGDSKYTDVIERALYNGVISGMSLDGKRFFYVNPLEVVPEASEKDHYKKHVKVERQKWFGCACCPPNLARLISSIGNYSYSLSEDTIWMNLYIGGKIDTQLNGKSVRFDIRTQYPWKETVEVRVETDEPSAFAYALRIPEWCRNFKVKVNGIETDGKPEKGYLYLERTWQTGDVITFTLDMPTVINRANPKVRENMGKVAVSRGPLVYCLEEADNGSGLHRVYVDTKAEFTGEYDEDLLGGIVRLKSSGQFVSESNWDEACLYKTGDDLTFEEKELTWIPYYAWTNRKPGEMMVWVHQKI